MIENGNVAKKIAELIKEAMNYNAINNQSPISIITIEIQKGLMKHLKKDIADLKEKIHHYSYYSNFSLETQDNLLLVKLPFEGQITVSDDELIELAASGKTDVIKDVLGEYKDEDEKNKVESIRYRWAKLQDEIFSFRDYVEEKRDMSLSDRAFTELNDILEEIDIFTNTDT